MEDRINSAASLLAAARLSGLPVEMLPVLVRPRDEAEAYWVQQAVHGLIARSRYGDRAGYKIACTTPVMRRYLGIRNPCSGGVFSGTIHKSGARLRRAAFQNVGVEGEIAVRMGRDLRSDEAPFDAANLADAVESYSAAIELVDNRYADWHRTDAPTLIADDFFGAACVLGEPVPAKDVGDVSELTGVLSVNGREVARGRGSDVMGHPLKALAWLANSLLGRGHTLMAGEVVLLGSFSEPQWLSEGGEAAVEIGPLGRAEVSVH